MTKITWVPSPSFSEGREDRSGTVNTVDFIVIHYIVGTLAAADQVFSQEESQVSAHYGIGEGQIHQYVREQDTAWHAGNFTMNTKSIGIEHSADTDRAPDESTYKNSIELCVSLCEKYRLDPRTAIIPHSQVVATLCPGTVDINRIIEGTAQGVHSQRPTKT
ncbi:N-acetylmuramoyl-L-alanine amidase [Psychromicrobium sp. YIM B11713]|uniref:peptidoglycan recognition protein family protein n=1 Tax=Psychromicrobium sp. YIM B11713 TaxID=3145233 RepID=UPI00374F227A